MKILLIVTLLIISILCWIFGTSATIDGKHTTVAFIIKSVFYWLAVTLSFGVGFYVA